MSDPGTIARPYAKAAFDYAVSHQQLSQWESMLQFLALLVTDEQMQRLLNDPKYTDRQLVKLMLDIAGSRLDQAGKNFLNLLASYERLAYLPFIFQQYEILKDAHLKIEEAYVVSAYPLSEELASQLKQSLEKKYQCKIELNVTVDPSVIGGARIRIGDKVIDGTALSKLHLLQNHLNAKERICQSVQ